MDGVRLDGYFCVLSLFDHFPCHFTADGGNLAFQVPDARLFGVVPYDREDTLVGKRDVFKLETVCCDLFLDKKLLFRVLCNRAIL